MLYWCKTQEIRDELRRECKEKHDESKIRRLFQGYFISYSMEPLKACPTAPTNQHKKTEEVSPKFN